MRSKADFNFIESASDVSVRAATVARAIRIFGRKHPNTAQAIKALEDAWNDYQRELMNPIQIESKVKQEK